MAARVERALVDLAGLLVMVDALEEVLLARLLDLVCTGALGVGMLDELLLLQVVVQIRVGQVLREALHDLVLALPDVVPAALGVTVLLGVLVGGLLGLLGHQRAHALEVRIGQQNLVLLDVLAQLRQHLLALVANRGEPAKVVEAEVVVLNILLVDIERGANHVDDSDRHVADVDDTSVGAQDAAALGHDGSGVGVVENPVVLLGVLLNVINQLDHGEDGAHAVGKAAAAAGLLTHAAVTQRNLLVLLAHGVAAHAHLGKHEAGVGEGGRLVGGHRKLDVQAEVLVQNPVHEHADLALALLVDVVQANLVNVELVLA